MLLLVGNSDSFYSPMMLHKLKFYPCSNLSKLILNFVLICFFHANAIGAAVSVENLIREAEDAFWFSMEEGGNPEALRTGLQLLSDAEIELSLHPDASLEDRLNALKLDLEKQLELSYDTLFGVFPVVRFATDSVWTNSSSLGTFEIIDDPKVMAVSSAVDRIRELMSKTIEIHGQLDVFFLSSPKDHDLENEALYLFNKDPIFCPQSYGHDLSCGC